jgi:hypothetical protein
VTTNEIELHSERTITNLSEQMDYARAVSVAALLPQAYRGKPADIMLAMGLGQAMGLSPAESLYRIDVIQGKPTASAELIAANVRKAGHRLRVFGDDDSATAIIIRADDPEFEFKVTRDRAWAQAMGLMSKDNYKKQFGTMLQWRAITAVARLACPEALYGVAYTPDEMTDMPGTADRPTGGLASILQTSGAEAAPGGEPVATVPVEPESNSAPESPLLNTRSALAKAMYAAIRDAGITKEETPGLYQQVTGRAVESSKELTDDEARAVLDYLKETVENPFPEPVDGELVEDGA